MHPKNIDLLFINLHLMEFNSTFIWTTENLITIATLYVNPYYCDKEHFFTPGSPDESSTSSYAWVPSLVRVMLRNNFIHHIYRF